MKTKQENIILDSQGLFSKIWSTQLKRYLKPIEKKQKKRVCSLEKKRPFRIILDLLSTLRWLKNNKGMSCKWLGILYYIQQKILLS